MSIVVKWGEFMTNLIKSDDFTRKTKVLRNGKEAVGLHFKRTIENR
jgi:hypothetical protein